MAELFYCEKCNRTMGAEQFYSSNNLEKYPNDGKFPQCKKCLTMHVDNWNPDTYLWILEEADVPYIPDEWNKLMATYGKDPSKLTGMTIVGRYLSKMKLKQFKDYRWKDTAFLQEMAQSKIEQTMKRSGYDAQQIAEALDKAIFTLDRDHYEPPEVPEVNLAEPQEDYFAAQHANLPEETFDLSEEEQLMLRLKWGKTYKLEEWIKLEQLYNEFLNSYDIQSAGHVDTLKLICKTSLKANQLIDIGDIEGFQKMSKVYDSLMKSGKFTAAQNKNENGDFIDSIGELIEMCEKEGYIERYYVESPRDRVDMTIADMQRYTRTLIEEETSLPNMVEKALREIEKEDAESAKNIETDIIDDDDLSIEDLERSLKDQDFIDFDAFLEQEVLADENYLEDLE